MNKLEKLIEKRFDILSNSFPASIAINDARLNALLDSMGDLNKKRVLEVGCGKGRISRILKEKGCEIFGIDISENFLKEAKKISPGHFFKASATDLPFGSNNFDIVFAVEVIEHLPDLRSFLKESGRVLKVDGKIIIIDRNILSINNRRAFVPNLLVKKYHEIKNQWMYPRGFPYTEQWFFKGSVENILKKYFFKTRASYVMSDSEKRSRTAFLFKYLSISRHFILWEASHPRHLSAQLPRSFIDTKRVEKEFHFGKHVFTEKIAVYPKIADALEMYSGASGSSIRPSYPRGCSNIFSLRIDADEIDNEDFPDYIKLLEPFKDWVTIFCCASSFAGKEDLLKKCAETGFDIQSHGYYHHVYNDYANNLRNIEKAKDFFENFGIKAHGFAAPMGKYNDNLIKALENLGFVYSSDFAFDYLNMPHYPVVNDRISSILEVPVFPVCPELLFANGLSEKEVAKYFDDVLRELKCANIPIIFYAHTDKRYPQVKYFLKQLLENIKNYNDLYKCTMSEFVKWCKSVEDKKISRSNGLLNSGFYSGFLKIPDESLLGKTARQGSIKNLKSFVKDALDFETVTPRAELRGNGMKNRLKVFLRKFRSNR